MDYGPGRAVRESLLTFQGSPPPSLSMASPDEREFRHKWQKAFMDEPKNFPQSSNRKRKHTRRGWKQGEVTQEEYRDAV